MTDVRDPSTRPSGTRFPGPEVVAATLVAILLLVVGTGLVVGRVAAPVGPRASASPTPGGSLVPATPGPVVDPGVVDLLGVLNQRLLDAGDELGLQLEADPFRPGEVAALIREVNATVQFGADAIPTLGGHTGEDQVGGRLAAVYAALSETATSTLRASVTNETEYRTGAGAIIALIEALPPLQAELEVLADTPAPTAVASVPPTASAAPSPPPSAAPTPTPAPAATPAPTPTPAPGSPAPTPVAVAGEQIEDGGFEAGVGPPWEFRVGLDATATIAADNASPGAGNTSARIEIEVASSAYSGVSLRQPGLALQAGSRYAMTLSLRSEAPREIRLRITSLAGASYLTRLATVGPTWATVTFDFVAPSTDPDAAIEIELGRSDVTTWLDSVSFAPFAAPAASVPAAP